MKVSELRELSPDELKSKLLGLKRELLDLRIQASSGKLDKPHRVQIARRDAARLLTLLKESSLKESSRRNAP